MVEHETEVPPLQMPWSYYSFNLILAVPSAKTFLCDMIQLPQFLWILNTLKVDTYLYTHPNGKYRVYTSNDYIIDAISLQWVSQYHMLADVAALCSLHCIEIQSGWPTFIWFNYNVSWFSILTEKIGVNFEVIAFVMWVIMEWVRVRSVQRAAAWMLEAPGASWWGKQSPSSLLIHSIWN